jgi:TPP-dependent trihydroxycyclohexane-1,2-dione (THcHDO) dehydratase
LKALGVDRLINYRSEPNWGVAAQTQTGGRGGTTDRTTLITIVSDAFTWTPGDAWWDVAVPATSERKAVREAHVLQLAARQRQRVGV